MAITKILNIKESKGRNPATHLENALQYIMNPDKTEECVLVGSLNCLPDMAYEQMVETKNVFHKTGNRQGYHVIISFSPEENVTPEQAMYVLEHFKKDVLGDDYEAVFAVHTDKEHMHGHLIWNSVSLTTGLKYNSPKGNWKNHLQPVTNKYCKELGLDIQPAEYSKHPKNISREKWEQEMSMKEYILRDARFCAYAAGNVEHFKYLMKSLGYVFKNASWLEVQVPGFQYYHSLAKMDEMFEEDNLKYYMNSPYTVKPGFYTNGIKYMKKSDLTPFQKKYYTKIYRLRIIEQKRFTVGSAKYAKDLQRMHQLQDEYLMIVNNDIKDVGDLLNYREKQENKIQAIDDRQHAIYKENSNRKRKIKTEEQLLNYQLWHVGIQKELDKLKEEKRATKKELKLAENAIKENIAMSLNRGLDLERIYDAVIEDKVDIPGMNYAKENNTARESQMVQTDGNVPVEAGTEAGIIADYSNYDTEKKNASDLVTVSANKIVGKLDDILMKIQAWGDYDNIPVSVKAEIFDFGVTDVSGDIKLFSEVMERLGIKLDNSEQYEAFQEVYDATVVKEDSRNYDFVREKQRSR